jgi:hypothetical protein
MAKRSSLLSVKLWPPYGHATDSFLFIGCTAPSLKTLPIMPHSAPKEAQGAPHGPEMFETWRHYLARWGMKTVTVYTG